MCLVGRWQEMIHHLFRLLLSTPVADHAFLWVPRPE